jgi:hypothetical protein
MGEYYCTNNQDDKVLNRMAPNASQPRVWMSAILTRKILGLLKEAAAGKSNGIGTGGAYFT